MSDTRIAVIWDKPIMFTRLIEDCGHSCELVTPNILAAPFFRKKFHGVLIPAGFAAPGSAVVLAALRAISSRIKRYVEEGGTILAFGAAFERNNAYDWLPVQVEYRFGFSSCMLYGDKKGVSNDIVEDISEPLTIDGTIVGSPGEVILTSPDGPVLISITYGYGKIIITSLHEYPSRKFITGFCSGGTEGLL